jgi:hypothetical protein
LDKKNNKYYLLISIVLLAAIAALVVFVIIPKYSPVTPNKILNKINFSNPTWIEQYVDKIVGIYGKDFYQSTAFSYTPTSSKMVVTYASQKIVQEARDYYLTLPQAKQSGRNDETSLNVSAEIDDQPLEVYNYFSPIARVIELKLDLNQTNADKVIQQLEKAFPEDELINIPEIEDILKGEFFGGYVRYQYDNLDSYTYPNIPIFSRAYIYDGTEDDFNKIINTMNEKYPTNKYDETQDTYYYQINGYIVSLSNFVTDTNENVISVGIQKMETK